jgi:hypothetical protein
MMKTAAGGTLVSVLILGGAAAWGAAVPDNLDLDGIPDATENWLLSIGVNNDDSGAAISPGAAVNTYNDTDNDGLPDIIEANLTGTVVGQDDTLVCVGGGDGAADLTGQWGLRVSDQPPPPVNFLIQSLSAVSICHTGPASLTVFHPRFGFADTTSFAGGAFSAIWNTESVTIAGTYSDNGTPEIDDDRLDGSYTANGVTQTLRSRRNSRLTGNEDTEVPAVYGFQAKALTAAGQVIDDPRNPASFGVQLTVNDVDAVTAILYDDDGSPSAAYYVPSVAALFSATRLVRLEDRDGDGLDDDSVVEDTVSRTLFTQAPVARVGGLVRGVLTRRETVDLDVQTAAGIDLVETRNLEIYGVAALPRVGFFTEVQPSGQQLSRLFVQNVPTSADSLTLTGSGSASSFGSVVVVDNTVPGQAMQDLAVARNLIPGLTEDPAVGIGSNIQITQVSFDSAVGQVLVNGDYTFSFSGDAGSNPALLTSYVATAVGDSLPAVVNAALDATPLSPTPLPGVDPATDHVLSWDAVTTGGSTGTGAGTYQIRLSRSDGGRINFADADQLLYFQSDDGGISCPDPLTGKCTITLAANILEPNGQYCLRIQARDRADNSNRSRSDELCLTTTQGVMPTVIAAVLPTSRSVQVGNPATAFAAVINTGSTAASNCRIAPVTSVPADFLYQTTDPATNALTGTPNTPIEIAAGAIQTFLFALTPSAPFPPTDVQLDFECTNTDPAPSTVGLNTLLLSASSTPVPDIVALAATLTGDGILDLPGVAGANAFAVATVNVGANGNITVSADTGDATLPMSVFVCQTNPVSGLCLAPPASSVTTTIDADATPTFSVFAIGDGVVPFDPANNRIFVAFRDGGGVVRGSTSVAVRTQ